MEGLTIRQLAKLNIDLLEDAKKTKAFLSTFNRSVNQRINEHIEIIDGLFKNIETVTKQRDLIFETLGKDIDNQLLKEIVQNDLQHEIKLRKNVSLVAEHIGHITHMLDVLNIQTGIGTFSERRLLDDLRTKGTSLIESFRNIENDNDTAQNRLSSFKTSCNKLVQESVKLTTKYINTKLVELNDLGSLAAEYARNMPDKKARKQISEWWETTLQMKRNELEQPKKVILALQKAITTTTQKLTEMRKVVGSLQI